MVMKKRDFDEDEIKIFDDAVIYKRGEDLDRKSTRLSSDLQRCDH